MAFEKCQFSNFVQISDSFIPNPWAYISHYSVRWRIYIFLWQEKIRQISLTATYWFLVLPTLRRQIKPIFLMARGYDETCRVREVPDRYDVTRWYRADRNDVVWRVATSI